MIFERLDLTELDKDLSEEQRKEWNAIYASYRSRSVLTGRVAGMDITSVTLKNQETGDLERKEINCLVVIEYRVKILIPEQEIWFDEKTRRPSHVLRSMAGSTIDYVITAIDREGECCVASRREALNIRAPFRFFVLTREDRAESKSRYFSCRKDSVCYVPAAELI